MNYEENIENLSEENPTLETREVAEEAMGFVLALHNMFKEQGVSLPDDPDCSLLENYIDSIHGELAAACLFLSEDCFERVPSMLRTVASQFETLDKDFADPSGEKGPSVPVVVRNGFSRLADRIEATRQQLSAAKVLVDKA